MTRSGLIKRLAAAHPHLYARDLERIVDTVFERIGSALARGERVELRGFGAFSTRGRGGRVGRNPRTGAEVAVPGKLRRASRPAKSCSSASTLATGRRQSRARVAGRRRPSRSRFDVGILPVRSSRHRLWPAWLHFRCWARCLFISNMVTFFFPNTGSSVASARISRRFAGFCRSCCLM